MVQIKTSDSLIVDPLQPLVIPVSVVKREATEAERLVKLALRASLQSGNHTYSMAQLLGIYPT